MALALALDVKVVFKADRPTAWSLLAELSVYLNQEFQSTRCSFHV